MTRKLPLIVVLGATACGKSKLAVELARRFNGEIISADSMQVYRGLDIVTNKVTEEEQQQAKHHMINILNPSLRYSVVDFRNKSLEIIANLMEKDSLPIVVGGTNYYIESLLWKSFLCLSSISDSPKGLDCEQESRLDSSTIIDTEAKLLTSLSPDSLHTEEDLEDVNKFFEKQIYNEGFSKVSGEKLWRILEQVDEESAHLYHPNDKRRIIRCLQIIQENRKNYSELLKTANKSSKEGKDSLGGPLRYEPTCVLWLSCDSEKLDRILDQRVDQMLDRGLLNELERFHEDYNRRRVHDNEKPDYEKGIFQTIGFKEFHDYLMLSTDEKPTEEGNQVLKKSIHEMKLSTRRYAKRQLQWITRRFLQAGKRDLPPVFKLPTSFDEEEWGRNVRQPAFEIVESMIEGWTLSDKILSLRQHPEKQSVSNQPGKYYCEACDKTFIGSHYIDSHLKSKTHERKKAVFNRNKESVNT